MGLQCQRAKVHRHVATLGTFATPDTQFDYIHIDLIGLPQIVVLLICVDRFTRCLEAIPIADSSAVSSTCVDMGIPVWCSLYHYHRSRWTVSVTPVEGFTQLLGTKHTCTTAYHPIIHHLGCWNNFIISWSLHSRHYRILTAGQICSSHYSEGRSKVYSCWPCLWH